MSKFLRIVMLVPAILSAIVFSGAALAAEAAPDFTLKSKEHGNLKLSEQRGQVIMLNFWASWCGPCRQEMPLLDELHQRYSKAGFQVWGLNVDANQDDAERMLAKIPVTFPVLFDPEGIAGKLFSVEAMPTSVFIDRDGNIRYVHKGYRAGEEDTYRQYIKELIRE